MNATIKYRFRCTQHGEVLLGPPHFCVVDNKNTDPRKIEYEIDLSEMECRHWKEGTEECQGNWQIMTIIRQQGGATS